MISIVRAALGALLLSAFAVGNPIPAPAPQGFITPWSCPDNPAGSYTCAVDNLWIAVCDQAHMWQLAAECNGHSCGYDSQGIPHCYG